MVVLIIINYIMIEEISEQDEMIRLDEVRLRVRDEGIEPLRKVKTEIDKNFIKTSLKNHFIFYNLSDK